ncbi:MAG: HIT family protein [Mycoplasmataceae bacterium]|nr:HIT family protein [Mycoplasmataceae bacterium]
MEKDIFEKIIDREVPSSIIFEDERIIAFYDIDPVSKGHFLVVPKKFSRNLKDIDQDTLNYMMEKARELAAKEIKNKGVDGYRLIINSEPSGMQVIFRTHIHIIPARVGDKVWINIKRGEGVY